jgi:voltage-gated potassium channel
VKPDSKNSIFRYLLSLGLANNTLFIMVLLTIFFIPLLPLNFHRVAYNLMFTTILLIGTQLVSRRRKFMLILTITAVFMVWLTQVLDLVVINGISKGFNIVLFMIIVFDLVKQVSMAKDVSAKVILESINGYLMIGLVFSIMAGLFTVVNPASYNIVLSNPIPFRQGLDIRNYVYYAFITLTTTGYGDIVPLAPAARSLAVLISVTGQLYVTIVIALLIGKYLSRGSSEKNDSN